LLQDLDGIDAFANIVSTNAAADEKKEMAKVTANNILFAIYGWPHSALRYH